MNKESIRTLCFCILLLVSPGLLSAQDRGDGRRMERRGGDNEDRSAQIAEWLTRMDRDESGYLEPQEIRGRAREWVQGMGFSLSRPIAVADISKKMAEDRAKKEKEELQKIKDENRKVPGFQAEFDLPAVPGFEFDSDDPLAYSGDLDDRYGKEIAETVKSVMAERDKDQNGTISMAEAREHNWGAPDPRVSDINHDGQLTAVEIAERLKKRNEQASNEQRRGDLRRQLEDQQRAAVSGGQRLTRENPRGQPPSTTNTRVVRNAPAKSLDSKIADYANDLLGKYDKNKDGQLDAEERKEINTAIKDYDNDGVITRQEIEQYIGGARAPSTGGSRVSAPRSGSSSSSGESASVIRRSEGWEMVQAGEGSISQPEDTYRRRGASSTFLRYDQNKDGQIQMSEFSTTWDQEKLDEFKGHDKNGDGIISIDEWGINVSERSSSSSRRRRDD